MKRIFLIAGSALAGENGHQLVGDNVGKPESCRLSDNRGTPGRPAGQSSPFSPHIIPEKSCFQHISLFLTCDGGVSGAVQGNRDVHGAGDERAARQGLRPRQLLLQRGPRAEDRGGEVKK